MNVHLPAPRRGWPSRLANLAVVIVVLALAAATFVLSYTGVHAIALRAGVSPRLARIYPGVFDAVLVIACAAAVMLRDARWWARCYAWVAIIVVVGVVGAADAVHAMNVALPHRQTEGVVAAAPWVLVLLGFSLMLTMLRQSRGQHATATAVEPPAGLAGRPAVPALPPAADAHPPTLAVPVFTEQEEPFAAPAADAEHDDPSDPGDPSARDDEGTGQEPAVAQVGTATQEAPPEEQTASLRHPSAPDPADWAAEHGAGTYAAPQAAPVASWLERVADSGDPGIERHDYWDTDDEAGFTTVPRLNRVRATPIPPEEEDE
jgi:uncharacterized protein DUF2637